MDLVKLDAISLWSAQIGYVLICVLTMIGLVFRRRPEKAILALMGASVMLHTIALGARWVRLDRVPVIGGYEMLSANVWGLMLAVTLAYWRLPRLRPVAALLMPVIIMIMAWMLLKPTDVTAAPSTYDTAWLFVHIGFIKLFLGCAFIALGMAGIVLLRGAGIGVERFAGLPGDKVLDDRAYRFMALGLIFDTLGVVAGAIWAKDAWGRYWSWDTLETWSLVTWLSIGLMLHVRASFKTPPRINSLLIVGVFLVAFFTFFGIPFVSTALHKGQI